MSYMCHMSKFLSASRVFAQALSALVLWQGLSRGPSDLDRLAGHEHQGPSRTGITSVSHAPPF